MAGDKTLLRICYSVSGILNYHISGCFKPANHYKQTRIIKQKKGGSDDCLSLAFGGKFSHKLDHFWPNLS